LEVTLPRRIIFGTELRKTCADTMNILNKAVSSSLGPSGKLSLLDREKQKSLITKDGVTIAKNCLPLADEAMNLVGGKILEIANKTNEESGDGTTTSIVLADALFKEAIKHIRTKNIDPVIVKDEIEATLPKILETLDKMAIKINSFEEMQSVATISANNDAKIGLMIAKAVDAVGQDGFVTLAEGDTEEPSFHMTEGYQIAKGPATARFLRGKVAEEFDNPNILLVDGTLNNVAVLNNLYAQVAGQAFVIIGDLSKDCQEYMIDNSRKERMDCVSILPPLRKEKRVELLHDIAAVIGATVVDPVNFNFSEGLDKKVLGKAKTITFNKYHTNIVEGQGDKATILSRIQHLKKELDATKSDYERDQIRERIGSLTGGTAVLGVGGRTDDEILERKDRFEDSLNATRSALESGVIAGGGFALFQIAQKLKPKTIGDRIFKVALEAPMRQIISNTGLDVEEVVEKVRRSKKGYNAKTHKMVDLIKEGIIDPLKSTKSGLKNAVSIVDLLINLQVLSVNILDKDNAQEMIDAMKNINAEY